MKIKAKKAKTVFPFMTEINEIYYDRMDIYDENFIEESTEEDFMNAEEQGFMIGYLEA